jgi:DNA-binding beta-propeller fold protein YncE
LIFKQAWFLYLVLGFVLAGCGYAHALDFSVYNVRGFEGKGPVEFNQPEDILVTSDGRIVVADQRNNRIQVLTREGDFIKFIPQLDKSDESSQANFNKLQKLLIKPTGIALDSDNNLYVTSQDTHSIIIINLETGQLINSIGKQGKGQGQLSSPMDIDVHSDGRIAVAEWRNRRVQILDHEGNCLNEVIYNEETSRGYKAVAPRGVFWTIEGYLIVAYPLYHQVVCWNIDKGEVLWRYGIKGNKRGALNNPSYVANSNKGNFLISDTLNHRIVEISRDGKYVRNYPIRKGSAPGRLISPRGLALSPEETLVVSDQGNNRIHLFQPGQATVMLREVKELALKDQWEIALPKIERILYLQPNNSQARELMVNALYYFGDKAFAAGDFSKAEDNFRRILRYRPNDPNVPEKLDAIFWAANQGLIANVVFGIIAVIIILILVWMLKILVTRFIFSKN